MAKARIPKSARFTAKSVRPPQGLPDRETLLKFIREAGETDKADMAKAFGLKGNDRRALRDMVKQLEAEGALGKRGRKGFSEAGALPPVGVVDVVERDPDGDLLVKLTKGEDALTEYRFNTQKIQHLFCEDCGIESFARGAMPDGTPMVAINVRCLAGVEPTELNSTMYDGRAR